MFDYLTLYLLFINGQKADVTSSSIDFGTNFRLNPYQVNKLFIELIWKQINLLSFQYVRYDTFYRH